MADRATSVRNGLSHGSRGPELLMQWVHSRLHHVPVIWIQSVEKRRNGATGAAPMPEATVRAKLMGRSREDALGDEGGYDPVGRVHDLADLEVGSHAADDVGLLTRESALAHEVIDHVEHRPLGGGEEIGAVRGGGVPRPRVGTRREAARGAELRLLEAPAALEARSEERRVGDA